MHRLTIVAAMALSAAAFAQESEFKTKMQEDLDGYKDRIQNNCGATEVSLSWTGGKLGHNPRESEKPEWNSLSTLCTSGLEAVETACSGNAPVKAAVAKVKKVECKKGKGTLGYTLKGNTLTVTVDGSFTKNNAAGQRDDLVTKMKKDLDT